MVYSFERLIIWQKSEKLVVEIYKLTNRFPKKEMFNLISQLRRAVVSVPTNIAEAMGRYHDAESIHFLYNSRGSAEEVRSLLMTSRDLEYISEEIFRELNNRYIELIRSMNGFIKSFKNKAV